MRSCAVTVPGVTRAMRLPRQSCHQQLLGGGHRGPRHGASGHTKALLRDPSLGSCPAPAWPGRGRPRGGGLGAELPCKYPRFTRFMTSLAVKFATSSTEHTGRGTDRNRERERGQQAGRRPAQRGWGRPARPPGKGVCPRGEIGSFPPKLWGAGGGCEWAPALGGAGLGHPSACTHMVP